MLYFPFRRSLLTSLIAGLAAPALADTALEEVFITSSRVEIPLSQVGSSVSVVSKADIELQGTPALMDIFRTQPGITVSNTGGPGKQSTLRIRGEEGYRTLVLIDGVEMSDPSGTQVSTAMQHIQSGGEIERVEILRGPQGFMYGADAGGVINIFTQTPDQGLTGAIGVEGGRYETRNAKGHIAYGNENGDILISVVDTETEGFNAQVSDTSGEADGYDNTTVHAKLGWNLAKNTRAQLVARSIDATNEYDAYSTHDAVGESNQTIGKLSLTHQGERLDQSVAYAITDVKRDNFEDGINTFDVEGGIHKAEYLGHYRWSSQLTTVFGFDHKQETVDRAVGKELSRRQNGAFAEIQNAFNEALYLSAGARFDNSDDFGEHTSLRISAAWLPVQTENRQLKLRTSLGNGFRAPALQEIAYNDSRSDAGENISFSLQEENSLGGDVGLEFKKTLDNGRRYSLEATLFRQTIEDEIYYDMIGNSGYYLQAEGKSTSQGLELAGDYSTTYFSVYANATFNDTETREDEQRTRRPKRSANMGTRVYLLENSLNMQLNLRLAQDAVNEIFGKGIVPLDDYQVVDFSINWRTGPIQLNGRITNLTNQHYQEITGYNTAERAATLGATYLF